MNNKKGQFEIYGIAALLAITLIFLGFFVFSTQFRFVTIGAGLIVVSFVVLLKPKLIKNEKTKMTIFLIILALGLIMIVSSGFMQSVMSVSKVTEINGQPFWLASGTANHVDDGFQFNFIGTDYKLKNGKGTYEPQKAVSVFIDKSYSGCSYQLQKVTKYKNNVFFGETKIAEYKVLIHPIRVAKIKVYATGMKNPVTMNAFNDRKTLNSAYGNGKMTIGTLGIIGGEKDCPDVSNIALIGNRFVYKNELDNFIKSFNDFSIFSLPSEKNVRTATAFTNEFDKGTLKISSNEVTGRIDIGSVLYTLEANADFFDSIFVKSAPVIKPVIKNINFKNEINTGESSELNVNLYSSNSGNVLITATSNGLSISPSERNILLDGNRNVNFNVVAGNSEGDYKINVEACGSSQFNTEKKCTSKSINVKINKINQDIPQNQTNQPNQPNQTNSCSIFETPLSKNVKDWQWYNIVTIGLISPQTHTETSCVTAGWVKWTFISIIIIVLGWFAIETVNKKGKRK